MPLLDSADYAMLAPFCVVDALQGFRNHAIATPVGFDVVGVVVALRTRRSASLPFDCNR